MDEIISFMGKRLARKQLFSKTFILALLEEEGPNFTTLMNVRKWHEKQFGNDLCWDYPFSQGMHNGILFLPVQEGFLALPYDEVDSETYEQFVLENAALLTADMVTVLEQELRAYTEGLFRVLADMCTALSSDGKGAPR